MIISYKYYCFSSHLSHIRPAQPGPGPPGAGGTGGIQWEVKLIPGGEAGGVKCAPPFISMGLPLIIRSTSYWWSLSSLLKHKPDNVLAPASSDRDEADM